jgi:hypothetical protein
MIYPYSENVANIDSKNLYYSYLALKDPVISQNLKTLQDALSGKISNEELNQKGKSISGLVNSVPLGVWQDMYSAYPTKIGKSEIKSYNDLFTYDNYGRNQTPSDILKQLAYISTGVGLNNSYSNTFANQVTQELQKRNDEEWEALVQNINSDEEAALVHADPNKQTFATKYLTTVNNLLSDFRDKNYTWTDKVTTYNGQNYAIPEWVQNPDAELTFNLDPLAQLLGAGTKERPLDFLERTSGALDKRDPWQVIESNLTQSRQDVEDYLSSDQEDKSFEATRTPYYDPHLWVRGGNPGEGGINYALRPGDDLKEMGGSLTMIPSASGDVYYVTSSRNGPQISVASGDSYVRSLDTAKNITPIVNYNTAQPAITNASVINADLAKQAKEVQESITNALVKSVYAGVASQTDRPEYTIENKIGEDLRIFQNAIAPITPITPIPQEYLYKKISEQLTQDQNFATKIDTIKKEEDAFGIEAQKKKDAEELERQKRLSQSQLDIQAQKNAEIEAKKLADAKFAEGERLRLANQFDYDSQIEAALRAAEGNSAFARKQRQNMDVNQKIADAEMLDKTKSTGGNPLGYAGGFAEKAIEKSAPTPQSLKIPSFARPPAPPITPVANSLTASSLLPSLEGLQFGGN